MAIAVVNTPASSNQTVSNTSLTHNFTCNSGTDCLCVIFGSYGNMDGSGNTIVTGATYNSVAMALAAKTGNGAHDVHIFVLKAPTTGSSQAFVINFSSATPFGGLIIPICSSGVDQTTPVGTVVDGLSRYNGSQSSPLSNSISMASGSVAFDAVSIGASSPATCDGSQTSIDSELWFGSNAEGASYKLNATAMQWTFSGGPFSAAHAIIELKAAGAAAGPTLSQFERITRGFNRGFTPGSIPDTG